MKALNREENGENDFASRCDQHFENFHEEIEQNIGKLIRKKNIKEGDAITKIMISLLCTQ